MTEEIINVRAPEVNIDSSASIENNAGRVVPIKPGRSQYPAGILTFAFDICRRLGLQYRSKDRAWEPLSGGKAGYANGRWVKIQRDGSFVHEGDGTPYYRQPEEVDRARIVSEYDALIADRSPADVVWMKVHPFPITADQPELRSHVRKRTVYVYHPPSEGEVVRHEGKDRLVHECASMVVVREDFTDEYIRANNLEGGNRKECIPYVAFDENGDVVWVPHRRAHNADWKTPLYLRHGASRQAHWYMVHEGEKAVDAAVAFSQSGSGHPLRTFLAQFTHVTWQGGALRSSVLGANWAVIDYPGAKIVLMPDADHPSYEHFANILPLHLTRAEDVQVVHWRGMRMNRDKMPGEGGWDIADPIPMEHGKPILDEATLRRCLVRHMPAYTKREYTAEDRKGKKITKEAWDIRPDFVRNFVKLGTKKTEIIDKIRPDRKYTFESFENNLCLCDNRGWLGKHMAREMTESGHLDEVDGIGMRPGGSVEKHGSWKFPPVGVYVNDDGDRLLNSYVPPAIVEKAPLPRRGESSAQLRLAQKLGLKCPEGGQWHDTSAIRAMLLDSRRLIPNPRERKSQIRLECNVLTAQNRNEFVEWGCIIASKKPGTGKTTRVEMVAALLGSANSFLGLRPVDTVGEKNAALQGKRLISLEEIKEDEKNPIYEPAKNLTNKNRVDRRMYADPAKATDTMLTIFGLSNHPDYAVRLDPGEEDRRWHIPTITEDAGVPPGLSNMAERYFGWRPESGESGFFARRQQVFDENASTILWFMRRYGRRCIEVPRVWKRPAQGGAADAERAKFTPAEGSSVAESSHSFIPVVETWSVAFRKAPLTEAKLKLMSANKHSGEVRLEESVGESDVLVLQDVEEWARDLRPALPRKRIEDWLDSNGFYRKFANADGSKNSRQGRVKFGPKPSGGASDNRPLVVVYVRRGSVAAGGRSPSDALKEWTPLSRAWEDKKQAAYATF